jgi:hypothetical protein
VTARPWSWPCALAAVVATLAVGGCDDVSVHIYTGQLYEAANACLDPSTAIDVVSGGATSTQCTPVCLVGPATTSPPVYISTVCPPYPGAYFAETEADIDGGLDAAANATDPCVPAFIAYDQGASCVSTGSPDGGDAASGGDSSGGGGDATMTGDSGADAPADGTGG